jgi:hypothetical protein
MKEPAQWELLRGTKPPSRGVLLLIVAALVLPTRSYFLQEIRFWLAVVAVLVTLGALLLLTFVLLQEASQRGLHWMKLHLGRITVARYGRIILRSAMPRHLPHH